MGLVLHRILCRRLMKRQIRVRNADLCQLFCGQITEGGGEHSRKRKILPCIVQYFQIIQKYADLVCLKVSFPAHRVCRNPFLRQHCREILCPSPNTPGQDHDISVPDPPISAGCLIDNYAVSHQFLYAAGDHPRLRLPCVLLPGILPVQKEKLRAVSKPAVWRRLRQLWEIRPHVQSRAVIVLDAAQILPHDAAEDFIYTVQHFRAASEVLMKVNALFVTVRKAVRVVFLHEKFRP